MYNPTVTKDCVAEQYRCVCLIQVPLCSHAINLIPTWISIHIYHKVGVEITNPSPNSKGASHTLPGTWSLAHAGTEIVPFSYLSPMYQCVHSIRFHQTHYGDWILPTRVWMYHKQVRSAIAIALSWTGVALNALKLSQKTDIFKQKFVNWKWSIWLRFSGNYFNS